jgi:hypothetical protein
MIIGKPITLTNALGSTMTAFSLVRSNGVTAQMTLAQADTAAHAAGLIGTCVEAPLNGALSLVVPIGLATWMQFTGAPTPGNTAYLASSVAGQAQDTVPTAGVIVPLGTIAKVSGTKGLVVPLAASTLIGPQFFFNWVFEGNPDPSGAAPTWLSQSNFDAGPSTAIEFPINEPITQVLVEAWLPTYGWGSSAPTLKLTKNGVVAATVYALGSGGAGTVQFNTVAQSYARGDRLGLQLGAFGAGAITGSSLYMGRVFVIP